MSAFLPPSSPSFRRDDQGAWICPTSMIWHGSLFGRRSVRRQRRWSPIWDRVRRKCCCLHWRCLGQWSCSTMLVRAVWQNCDTSRRSARWDSFLMPNEPVRSLPSSRVWISCCFAAFAWQHRPERQCSSWRVSTNEREARSAAAPWSSSRPASTLWSRRATNPRSPTSSASTSSSSSST